MKKLIFSLFVVSMMFLSSPASAIEKTTVGTGVWYFMGTDAGSEVGYSGRVELRPGLNSRNEEGEVTFEFFGRLDSFHSKFNPSSEKIAQVEAEALTFVARKTLGWGGVWVELGNSNWDFKSQGDNTFKSGTYLGVGGSLKGTLNYEIGGHALPDDNGSIYAVGGVLSMTF